MRLFRGAVLVGVWLLLVGMCFGKEVYFRDGSILECESFWRSGEAVTVKVNRDVVLTFDRKEIDVRRTFRKVHKKAKPKRKVPAAHAQHPAAAPVLKVAATSTAPPASVAPAPSVVAPVAEPLHAASPPAPASAPSGDPQPVQAAPTPSASTDPALKKGAEPQNASPAPRLSPLSPAIGMTTLLASLIFVVVGVASMWRVFVKAGQSGVGSLIPIYNLFVLMEISGRPWWWLILLFIPLVGAVIGVLAMISLSEKFGKGFLFGLGLSFLPMFFFPILAFGDAQYEGSPAGDGTGDGTGMEMAL